MSKHRTKSLFYETAKPEERASDACRYTLKLQDLEVQGKVFKSAYQVYLAANTEWEAAMELCDGNYWHWEQLAKVKWFLEGGIHPASAHLGLEEWRKHKRLKEIDAQIKNLKTKADAGDTAAAKAILQLLKEADTVQKKQGRPKKTSDKNPLNQIVADFEAAKKRFQK